MKKLLSQSFWVMNQRFMPRQCLTESFAKLIFGEHEIDAVEDPPRESGCHDGTEVQISDRTARHEVRR